MGPPPSPGECARGGRGPMEYKVRLTHVASINPEYETYTPFQDRLILNGFLGSFRVFCKVDRAVTTILS
jgi:hypothetical protein